MLNNFPTTKPLVNLGIAVAFLLNIIAFLYSLYVGAYGLAARSIGTILTMVVIVLIVWLGTKQGWNEKSWRILSILMIVVGLGILLWGYLNS